MSEPYSPSCFLHSSILANTIAHDSSEKKEPKKVYLIFNSDNFPIRQYEYIAKLTYSFDLP